jgi:hypothetical protein
MYKLNLVGFQKTWLIDRWDNLFNKQSEHSIAGPRKPHVKVGDENV